MGFNAMRRAGVAVACGLSILGAATPALAGTVKYDLNGPAGVVHEHTEDGDVEVEEIGVDFDGIGKLTGWNTERDGSGTSYAVGDKVSGDATLYAQYDDGTMLATGLVTRDGKTYYYGPDGSLAHGKQNIGGKMMWFAEGDGARYEGTWISSTDGSYYAKGDGELASGLVDVDGKTYAFADDGRQASGFYTASDGSIYFADASDSNAVAKGKWVEQNGKRFYAGQDGKLALGYQKVDGKEYVFDANNGTMAAGTWTKVGDRYAYSGDDGVVTKWSDTLPGADENQGSSAGNGSSGESNNTGSVVGETGTGSTDDASAGGNGDSDDAGKDKADPAGADDSATGTDATSGTAQADMPQTGYASPALALIVGGSGATATGIAGLVGKFLKRRRG